MLLACGKDALVDEVPIHLNRQHSSAKGVPARNVLAGTDNQAAWDTYLSQGSRSIDALPANVISHGLDHAVRRLLYVA